MSTVQSSKNHPLLSFLYLILLAAAGMLIFTLMAVIIASYVTGVPILTGIFSLQAGYSNTNYLRIIQIASTIGTFIVPALLFARVESRTPFSYLNLNSTVTISLFFITVALIFFSEPILELTVLINQNMKLPGFLKGVEDWMKAQETQMETLTKQLLTMKTPTDLVINLVMIAILPAIGEELFFRGCLQQILIRWAQNKHVAIWITAIIFSAIHMQFYGFIPRMLLGALLGYLFVWGKNIWLPITAHFINNATSVIAAYVLQMQGKSINDLDSAEPNKWYIYLVSLILTISLLRFFYQKAVLKSDGEQLITNGE